LSRYLTFLRPRLFWFLFFLLIGLFFSSFAFAQVEKVKIEQIEVQKIAGKVFINLEVIAEGSGQAYLEASVEWQNKDYRTGPLVVEAGQEEVPLRFMLQREDFKFIDRTTNLVETLPEFSQDQQLVVYVYQKQITTWEEGMTEEIREDLNTRGYALRGILAKATQALKSEGFFN